MTASEDAEERLLNESLTFAGTLIEVLHGTVTSRSGVTVAPFETGDRVWIYPSSSTPGNLALVPLDVGLDADEPCRLFLKFSYVATLDDSGDHLAIRESLIHLMVDTARGVRPPRPVIRLEFDRDRGAEPDDQKPGPHRRSAAHVQIHETSAELAAVQTIRCLPLSGLDRIHIPVGGRRFRPTLEDFIESSPCMTSSTSRTAGEPFSLRTAAAGCGAS